MGCGSSTQNSSKAPSSAAQGRSSKSKGESGCLLFGLGPLTSNLLLIPSLTGLNDDKGANSTFLKDKKAAKSSLKGSKVRAVEL